MIIFCSNLPNDQDLIRALGSTAVPLSLFTDVAFIGVKEGGEPALIAVERKKIGDLSQCINDGRLVAQMQTCAEVGTDVFALVVEGRYRRNPDDGVLEIPVWGINPRTGRRAELWSAVRPLMQYSRFEQYLIELIWLARVIVCHTEHVHGTADTVRALYDNFQTMPYAHQSLNKIYSPPPTTVSLSVPGLVRRVAKELPGVGWVRSGVIADHFPSVEAMCEAGVKEWASLDGMGKLTAKRVVDALHGAE